MWVSRQPSFFDAGFARALPNEPAEYTPLMLIPPVKATCPSTTRILRWSRLLISQPRSAFSGLTRLNSHTAMPAARNYAKYSDDVLSDPPLSYRTFTRTPCARLRARSLARRWPTPSDSRV